ncbi:hypothetical protein A2U01_0114194, partial [Trifolium medium]|nr:hypothetical protein [Trifolium medium]
MMASASLSSSAVSIDVDDEMLMGWVL